MSVERIEYIIKSNGDVEERVIGVKGPGCKSLTREIEEKLGDVEKREHTSEFYEQPIIEKDQQVTGTG